MFLCSPHYILLIVCSKGIYETSRVLYKLFSFEVWLNRYSVTHLDSMRLIIIMHAIYRALNQCYQTNY